jgi:hypothetical protein
LEEIAVELLGWRWRQQARLTEIQPRHEAKTPVAGSDAPTEPAQPETEERAASESRVSMPELATTLPPITVTPPAHPGETPGPFGSDPTVEKRTQEDAAPFDVPETQPVPSRADELPSPLETAKASSPAPSADIDPATTVQPRETQGRPKRVLRPSWLGQHVMLVAPVAVLLASALVAVTIVATRGSPGRDASRQTTASASGQASEAAVAAAVAANPVEAQRVRTLAAWIVKERETSAVEEAALARGLPRSQAEENATLHQWEAAAEGREQLIGRLSKAMDAQRTIPTWDASFLQLQIDKLTAIEKNISTIMSTMRGRESGPLVDPREAPSADAERFLAQFNPLSERYLGRTFSKADL